MMDLKQLYNKKETSYYMINHRSLHSDIQSEIHKIIAFIKESKVLSSLMGMQEKSVDNIVTYIRNKYKFEEMLISEIQNLEEIIKEDDIKQVLEKDELYENVDAENLTDEQKKEVHMFNKSYELIVRKQIKLNIHVFMFDHVKSSILS